jgi:hypothetical protein
LKLDALKFPAMYWQLVLYYKLFKKKRYGVSDKLAECVYMQETGKSRRMDRKADRRIKTEM